MLFNLYHAFDQLCYPSVSRGCLSWACWGEPSKLWTYLGVSRTTPSARNVNMSFQRRMLGQAMCEKWPKPKGTPFSHGDRRQGPKTASVDNDPLIVNMQRGKGYRGRSTAYTTGILLIGMSATGRAKRSANKQRNSVFYFTCFQLRIQWIVYKCHV